jgi:GNAT superfamily N-acetyltransferase
MVTFEWSDWENGWLWWFQSVYVDPSARRGGLFRALFEYVEGLARSSPDARGLRLYVMQANAKAKDTYVALGMRASGHEVFEFDLR